MADLAPPRFADLGAMTIAGLVRRYKPDRLSQLPLHWYEMQSRLGGLTGTVGGEAFGLWYNLVKGGGEFIYLAGVPMGQFAPIHPDLSRAILHPLHCAVFQRQAGQDVRRTVEAALSQWLPSSGRELSGGEGEPDAIERYSEQFNKTGEGPLEVWVPLKRK